ncbi:hypothetical protein ABEB36_005329 [Hypothenemus hampei]
MLKLLLIALTLFLSILLRAECRIIEITAVMDTTQPPSFDKYAKMARYIIHNSQWISVATISTQNNINGQPFVSLKSFSDGPMDNSTGIPYLYMTDQDMSAQDLLKNNHVTVMATLAQSGYCKDKNYDPQDPRCPKVMLTGQYLKLDQSSWEYDFGQKSLFARHPQMKKWPKAHGFYVAKIDIQQVLVLDYFGGVKHVDVEDYFKVKLSDIADLKFYDFMFI